MIDAEQTYLQVGIDTFTEQLQMKFNKEEPIIYNTFQNYLKATKERVNYEMRKSKVLGIPFGLKFVRGAYMKEENEIAEKKKIKSPVCDGYEATTENIHTNIKTVLENLTKGSEVMETIEFLEKNYDNFILKAFDCQS